MKIKLLRSVQWRDVTLGQLYINGRYVCNTLEHPVRIEKIPKVTAIPFGTYEVVVTWSPKFKRKLPLIKNVPNFEGIRIHRGNTLEDTEGCILVGEWEGSYGLIHSIAAEVTVTKKIEDAQRRGEGIILEIE